MKEHYMMESSLMMEIKIYMKEHYMMESSVMMERTLTMMEKETMTQHGGRRDDDRVICFTLNFTSPPLGASCK